MVTRSPTRCKCIIRKLSWQSHIRFLWISHKPSKPENSYEDSKDLKENWNQPALHKGIYHKDIILITLLQLYRLTYTYWLECSQVCHSHHSSHCCHWCCIYGSKEIEGHTLAWACLSITIDNLVNVISISFFAPSFPVLPIFHFN